LEKKIINEKNSQNKTAEFGILAKKHSLNKTVELLRNLKPNCIKE